MQVEAIERLKRAARDGKIEDQHMATGCEHARHLARPRPSPPCCADQTPPSRNRNFRARTAIAARRPRPSAPALCAAPRPASPREKSAPVTSACGSSRDRDREITAAGREIEHPGRPPLLHQRRRAMAPPENQPRRSANDSPDRSVRRCDRTSRAPRSARARPPRGKRPILHSVIPRPCADDASRCGRDTS